MVLIKEVFFFREVLNVEKRLHSPGGKAGKLRVAGGCRLETAYKAIRNVGQVGSRSSYA
jgi:hypothetical protein